MPKDPRDTVGQNPTGNARKSSAGKRRQVAANPNAAADQAARKAKRK